MHEGSIYIDTRFHASFVYVLHRWSALREKCLCSEFFWFLFSRIQTEYGEIRTMWEYTDQKIFTDTSRSAAKQLFRTLENSP